ncbi:MAG: RiPP maturation radical SAM C-methyltransferase, partial [Woeseiaceae bacterium]|nr:RiPP maturation radical SAM C-methyltransferase [Woeseiaceae bacterium]
RIIGLEAYKAMSLDYHQLIGERLFARAAYGSAPFGDERFGYRNGDGEMGHDWWGITTHQSQYDFTARQLADLEAGIDTWINRVAAGIVDLGFRLVGCSSSFQQTTSSVALLNAVKRLSPDTITMLGGSNCEGEMADGILSLGSHVDYVFSGESDTTFPLFLRQAMHGELPKEKIIAGTPCHFLDALPTPHYDEYFEQLETNLPGVIESGSIWISYETSRGCWWGEKSHCTFCGLNGGGMAFRQKSPDKVIRELDEFLAAAPTRNIMTTDNIMPNGYFKSLLPQLAEQRPGLNIHYEIKPNLTLEKVMLLHEAGVKKIQPGIEALSSSLLRRMGKGVTAAKNIDLLRYCRMIGLDVRWNILCHFPGDLVSDYEQTLELVGLLTHLEPPQGIVPLSIDRFSPYFEGPERYGISNLRPAAMYRRLLPESAELGKIAYHFEGDYDAASRERPDLVEQIAAGIEEWAARWNKEPAKRPKLLVQSLANDNCVLVDTRAVTKHEPLEFITQEQAIAALCISASTSDDARQWALERKCAIVLEGKPVSLALCEPQLMLDLQRQRREQVFNSGARIQVPDGLPTSEPTGL